MKPRKNVFLFISYAILLLAFLFSFLHPLKKCWATDEESELFLVAQRAFDDGFYDVAIRYVNEFLEKYPQADRRVQAQLLLGQCYFFKGQYLKAFDVFQGLLQYTSLKDATLFWLGETYLKGSDYKQAQDNYRQLIDVYPNSLYIPQAYYSLAWSYFKEEKFEEAKKAFLAFTKKFPAHELLEDCYFKIGECDYNLQLYKEATQSFRDYVLKFPRSKRHDQAYFYIAEAFYYIEDFANAITYYDKAIDISSRKKLTLLSKISLGWCYLKTSNFERSKVLFDEAQGLSLETNSPSDDIRLGQATLYSTMKDHNKALEAYGQLIEEFPDSPRIAEAHLGKANALYLLKKFDKATKQNELIIKKFIEDPRFQEIVEKAYFGLAWIYLKQDKIDIAIENFRKVINLTKSKVIKVSALSQIGDTYQDNGKFYKALEVYDKILKDYPESLYTDYIQYRQGIAFLKMEKIEAATIAFQSLKRNFPKSKYLNDAKYYLGLAYFKKNDWAAAKEELTGFIDASAKSHELQPEAHYLLGLSMFSLKKPQEAIQIFEKIAKNYPKRNSLVKDSEINIAKCLYSLGNDKEALKKFKIIIYKYPKTQTALESLLWLGDYYLRNSGYDNVILYCNQLVEQFPGSDKINIAYFYLGEAYEQRGLIEDALRQYKLIEASYDRELYAKAQLAIADIFSRDIDPDEAIETYQKITKSSPEFMRDAYVKIAGIHQNNRQYKQAIDSYQRALKATAGLSKLKNAELLFSIADMHEMLNKPNEAIETYLKIPYLYSEEIHWATKAYLRVARIFEDREDWDNAKTVYSKIIEQKTDEAKFALERIDWINENIATTNK